MHRATPEHASQERNGGLRTPVATVDSRRLRVPLGECVSGAGPAAGPPGVGPPLWVVTLDSRRERVLCAFMRRSCAGLGASAEAGVGAGATETELLVLATPRSARSRGCFIQATQDAEQQRVWSMLPLLVAATLQPAV
jgi:hypothetical protein